MNFLIVAIFEDFGKKIVNLFLQTNGRLKTNNQFIEFSFSFYNFGVDTLQNICNPQNNALFDIL